MDHMAMNIYRLKVEDWLSIGSGVSTVVDGDKSPHLVDNSGESYFLESCHYMGPIDGGVQLEEDVGNDKGCNYYPERMFTEHHHPNEEVAQLALGLGLNRNNNWSLLAPSLSPPSYLVIQGFYSGQPIRLWFRPAQSSSSLIFSK